MSNLGVYKYRIFIQIIKISISMSILIILASVIYSYCRNSSLREWKIIFTFLEAKVVGLFSSKNAIIYTLNNLLVEKVLLKFKYILYEGFKLAGTLHLLIFGSMILCLWLRQKIINDNPYPKLPEPKTELNPKILEPETRLESAIEEDPDQVIKVRNI